MKFTDSRYKTEYIVWPLIPLLSVINYFCIRSNEDSGAIALSLLLVLITTLTVFYYILRSRDAVVIILIGALIIIPVIGAGLKILHLAGADSMLFTGRLLDLVIKPVIIIYLLKKYTNKAEPISWRLNLTLAVYMAIIIYQFIAIQTDIHFTYATEIINILVIIILAGIIYNKQFISLGTPFQACIKSLMVIHLVDICASLIYV